MPFRVLVVDDETAIREAIRMTLEYEGYRIDEARSGQEGIDKATKTPYDAILLDIKMPVLDGIEVLENLKEQKVTAPVVMVSGRFTEPQDKVQGLELGADDYFLKPFDPVLFVARIKNLLRSSAIYAN